MDNEPLEGAVPAPRKRISRKTTQTATPPEAEIREKVGGSVDVSAAAAATEGASITCEYSDSLYASPVEDWTPKAANGAVSGDFCAVGGPKAVTFTGDAPRFNGEKFPSNATNTHPRRCSGRGRAGVNEGEGNNVAEKCGGTDGCESPERRDRPESRWNNNNNRQGNQRNGSGRYGAGSNENHRTVQPNHSQNPQRNSQQNRQNRRRPAVTIRIGAFSIGYLRGLEFLSQRTKLEEFYNSITDDDKIPLQLNEILDKSDDDLVGFLSSGDGDEAGSRSKMIDNCMGAALNERRPIAVRGILESMEGGDGIITYPCDGYKIRAKSTFVPRCLIQSFGLRRGQTLTALVHPPLEQSSCPFALKIRDVLGRSPEEAAKFPRFRDLVPYYPTKRIFLEQRGLSASDGASMRVIDLLSPIGFGQRGLIVAPPRTGKTMLLQGIANAIIGNQPEAKLLVLLIDERPEEVTDFTRHVKGAEVISSTFDESAESHIHAADIVIENARRWVEAGEHVVILLDSITRLARAYNAEQPNSGKVLSGGIEANALQLPKRFFGSARNIEGGGSLTIIATALIETGSRMDEVIFEEFKGTGNMELHLDRAIADKRIFPAINLERSGTRKEELLYHPDELVKIYNLRRVFHGVPAIDAMEMLIARLKKCSTNVEFLMNINR
jgi:transcription termination factor Rho